MTGSDQRSARDVVDELFRRQRAADDGSWTTSWPPTWSTTGRSAAWAFIHIWRVADGMLVEHWASRDDMGLLEQLGLS